MSIQSLVSCSRDNGVAWLAINVPASMNALSDAVAQALRDAIYGVRADPEVHALVLTGTGRAFCTGADLAALASGVADVATGHTGNLGNQIADAMLALYNPMILELQTLPIPVVCALNGVAAGAGVGLALSADVCIAARSAYLYLPSMPKLGLLPDLGSTWFLGRTGGRARAIGLALLGERLSAERAKQWGLIWDCVDDDSLDRHAAELAQRLARLPAHAALELRSAFRAAAGNGLPAQLDYEAARQRELLDSADFAEGVRAFLSKRDPVFTGRIRAAG